MKPIYIPSPNSRGFCSGPQNYTCIMANNAIPRASDINTVRYTPNLSHMQKAPMETLVDPFIEPFKIALYRNRTLIITATTP